MNEPGEFIWYELITPDPAAARRFYAPVMGWDFSSMPADGFDYTLAAIGGQHVAGVFPLPEGADMPPAWVGYIGVADVDAAVAAIEAEGGRVMLPAKDIAGVGRMAGVTDPQGVGFMVMRGASDETSRAFDPAAHGHVNWNEIATPDPARARAFYNRHFGWTKSGGMSMGEMGEYEFLDHGGRTIGAMMPLQDGPRPPSFLFYFGVPDIDRASRAITAGGGTVVHGPSPIPREMFITVALDPQGAAFGLVGPRTG